MRGENFGRAQHQRGPGQGAVVEGEGAPLAARREGRLVADRQRQAGEPGNERLDRAVGHGRARRVGGEQALELRARRLERLELVQADDVGRERPGLVGAEHVDVRQRLDRVGLLDQRPLAGHAHRAQGVGQDDGEDQAVGDQADDHGRRLHALDERQVLAEVLGDDQRHEGDRQDQQDPHEHVGLVLQGREKAAVRLGLGRDLVGEAAGADRLGLVAAVAGDAEAARQHGVAGALDDEVGLAGQQRLVELEIAPSDHAAVDHDLVAGLRPDGVADDELDRVDLALAAVAHHDGVRPGQDGDAVEGALGAHLLEEADHRVGQHDPDRQERVEVVAHRDQHGGQHEEEVVDEVEDVVADDLAVGAAGGGGNVVALAGRPAPRGLGLGQAVRQAQALGNVSCVSGNRELLGGGEIRTTGGPAARRRGMHVVSRILFRLR